MADGLPLILAMVDPPGEARSLYRWRLTHRSGDDAFGFAERQDLAQHAADLALLALGWEEVAGESPANALPSRFQIGDAVRAQPHGPCRVIAVHFARGKVRYDVQRMDEYDAGARFVVDSAFVQSYAGLVVDLDAMLRGLRCPLELPPWAACLGNPAGETPGIDHGGDDPSVGRS